jgi:Sortase domain
MRDRRPQVASPRQLDLPTVGRFRTHVPGTLAALAAGWTVLVVGTFASQLAQSNPDAPSPATLPGTLRPAGLDMPLATPLVAPADQGSGLPGVRTVTARVSRPVRLQIPAIKVDAGLGQVGLQSDGTIAVPSDWNQPAWYMDGPAPGQEGPAVIVGHLDSNTGPAIFWRLAKLKVGDVIQVGRQDGSKLSYTVTGVDEFARAAFPTAAVYGPTPGSVLRLITCGGAFDWSTHRYLDNVVVFANAG